jgi:hypothetical protein
MLACILVFYEAISEPLMELDSCGDFDLDRPDMPRIVGFWSWQHKVLDRSLMWKASKIADRPGGARRVSLQLDENNFQDR